MSPPDRETDFAHLITDFPVFELTYAFDHEETPTRVTVFSEEELPNRWISIDADHAIDLADVA